MPVDKADYERKKLSSKDCQGQPVAQGTQEGGTCPGPNASFPMNSLMQLAVGGFNWVCCRDMPSEKSVLLKNGQVALL